jgi:hypothetical protein
MLGSQEVNLTVGKEKRQHILAIGTVGKIHESVEEADLAL